MERNVYTADGEPLGTITDDELVGIVGGGWDYIDGAFVLRPTWSKSAFLNARKGRIERIRALAKEKEVIERKKRDVFPGKVDEAWEERLKQVNKVLVALEPSTAVLRKKQQKAREADVRELETLVGSNVGNENNGELIKQRKPDKPL